jgi:hypothetical protein
MSHVNAEKTAASVTGAGAAKMMDSMMGKMDMGSMMMGGMEPMMKGMGPMMKMPGVAPGVIVYTASSAGENVLKKIFTHPVVLFSLGVVVGCCVYKYRHRICSASVEPTA